MAHAAPEKAMDRRVRRTRSAIISAFNRLMLEHGHACLTAGDVAAAADVGRSTFYEHFRSVDEVLAEALAVVFAPLAEGCFEADQPEAARRAVAHIWENRRHARVLLGGESHGLVLRSFAALFASAFRRAALAGTRPVLDPELAGIQLAAGQLAVLNAWLSGRSGYSAREIADALHVSGQALSSALMGVPGDASEVKTLCGPATAL